MTSINRNESARAADGSEACERPATADGGESPGRRFGRLVLRRGLLVVGTAVGVRVGAALLRRRRRRSDREFTRIELDADSAER